MDIIKEIKSYELFDYIEKKTNENSFHVGSDTYRFKNCPICSKGDHFNVNTKTNLWNSFGKCGGGSIIDFEMKYNNIDKNQAISNLCKYFDIGKDNKSMDKKRIEVKSNQDKPSKEYLDIDLTPIIQDYYNKNYNDLRYVVVDRHIESDNVLNKYKLCGGDPRKIFKELNVLPQLNNISAYETVIPVWKNGKVVNCILRRNDKKSTENAKTLNLKNLKVELFNSDYLAKNEKVIFITEGIFDCLSIECFGHKSICLNSINMASRFVGEVERNIETCKNTKFVLALDNDFKGILTKDKITKSLKELGIKTLSLTIEGYKDINDCMIDNKDFLEKSIMGLFAPPNVSNFEEQFYIKVEENKNTKVISTGFECIDNSFNGGLYPALYVIGGISSLGKTALTIQMADNIAESGQHVLFFSLEMPKTELMARSISRKMYEVDNEKCKNVGTLRVLNGYIDNCNIEYGKACDSYFKKTGKHLTIIQGDFNMDIKAITDYTENFINDTGIKPVVFVDYLQIIDIAKDSITEKKGVDNIVKGLKMLSRDFNIPIMVVSSFNRSSYQDKVSFESFKESGGIEYTADFVIGLQLSILDDEEISRTEKAKTLLKDKIDKAKSEETREVTLVILKNRNGKSFSKERLIFNAKNNLFTEHKKVSFFDQ